MNDYIHRVQYYETDKMGVTHHSNYIRWMEEARVDYLDRIGCGYAAMETQGVISPVVGVSCRYLRSTSFDERITIHVELLQFKGVKLVFGYTMRNEAGKTVFTGSSEHCFLGQDGKPIILKKLFPEVDARMKAQVKEAEA